MARSDEIPLTVERMRVVRHKPYARIQPDRNPRTLNRKTLHAEILGHKEPIRGRFGDHTVVWRPLQSVCGPSTSLQDRFRTLRVFHTRAMNHAWSGGVGCRRRQKPRGVGVADGEACGAERGYTAASDILDTDPLNQGL